MRREEFAERVIAIQERLYKTAVLCLGSDAQAAEVLDEAVYRGLRGAGKLRLPEYFETWMTRILLNECRRELKRQSRLRPLTELEEGVVEPPDTLPLKEAVRQLPAALREVVVLRYFADCTLAETARILGIPQGTVVTRQRKALLLLRLELLEKEELP